MSFKSTSKSATLLTFPALRYSVVLGRVALVPPADGSVETGLPVSVGPLVGHVALAGEPELAVVLLVVDHVHEVGEHLAAVAADQDVRAA